jgi:hypothetical protein
MPAELRVTTPPGVKVKVVASTMCPGTSAGRRTDGSGSTSVRGASGSSRKATPSAIRAVPDDVHDEYEGGPAGVDPARRRRAVGYLAYTANIGGDKIEP